MSLSVETIISQSPCELYTKYTVENYNELMNEKKNKAQVKTNFKHDISIFSNSE